MQHVLLPAYLHITYHNGYGTQESIHYNSYDKGIWTTIVNHTPMKTTTLNDQSVGIDVASKKLDVYLRQNANEGIHNTFINTESGINKLLAFLTKHSFSGLIVMESTGRYHGPCAVMLTEAGFSVSVVNPLSIKKYQNSQIRKTKTDKIDAQILSEVAVLEKNLPLFNKTRADIRLRQKLSLLKSLETQLQSLTAATHNYETGITVLGGSVSQQEEGLKESINTLRKTKEKLEQEVVRSIQKNEDNRQNMEQLMSIPGVSAYYAAMILFFFSLEEGQTVKQWVAYAGMDVTVLESGSWRGRGRLSKRGNRYVRKRGFCSGWGAIMHSAEFRTYYDTLRAQGRSYTESIVIIQRKILRIAHTVLKNNTSYDPSLCFSS